MVEKSRGNKGVVRTKTNAKVQKFQLDSVGSVSKKKTILSIRPRTQYLS